MVAGSAFSFRPANDESGSGLFAARRRRSSSGAGLREASSLAPRCRHRYLIVCRGEKLAKPQSELGAAVVERVLEDPEDDPEHYVADRRLAEGSRVVGELRQLVAGGVVAVEHCG